LSALEDRYQVDLNETRFASARTVGELESLVRGSSPVRSESVFPRWAQRWPVTWIRTFSYYLLTWPATHLMAHPRVFGRENLRGVKGPVLVIANHVIYLDVGFVLAALPVRLRHRLAVAMGGERLAEMRRPPSEMSFPRRWLQRMNYFLVVSLFNVFPLPKKSGFRESFRFAGDLADRGWSILVFPEGDLTPDGKLQPFRAGIGLLASNLKIPVLPTARMKSAKRTACSTAPAAFACTSANPWNSRRDPTRRSSRECSSGASRNWDGARNRNQLPRRMRQASKSVLPAFVARTATG
jgi:long-chain acyl-CoA synthetase